jgi:hypothetical protein
MSQIPVKPDRRPPPGTPRWVKVFVIIFIALVVLFVVLHLLGLGFGGHGGPVPSGGMGDTLPGNANNTLFADLADFTPTIEHMVQHL